MSDDDSGKELNVFADVLVDIHCKNPKAVIFMTKFCVKMLHDVTVSNEILSALKWMIV